MIENTKCECGHQNAVGTILCEYCGKPLHDEDSDLPLEMRYDGVARRSQRSSKSIIDRVWRFFSSVKVAVYLIVITLVLAILGTIFPQENMLININYAEYYKKNYGVIGQIYHFLGLSHTYETWWFRGLLFMIGTSLVICSLDRVLPLYRALSNQAVKKHPKFISRQKVTLERELPAEPSKWIDQFGQALKKKRYRVVQEDDALLAEKNRFSRWGPYVNHIGLIIFLLAALMRLIIPGWQYEQYVPILEGDTVKIEGTPYYLKNEQFTIEFHEPDAEGNVVPRLFRTQAVLYECVDNCDGVDEPVLEVVKEHAIEVNSPLEHDGLAFYQYNYNYTPIIRSMEVKLEHVETGEVYGTFPLRTNDPEAMYEVGPYEIELRHYLPDFTYENGEPATKSKNPNAPAFIFLIKGPGLPQEGNIHIYFPIPDDQIRFQQDRVNEAAGSQFRMSVGDMENVEIAMYTSYLNIKSNKGMTFIWIGSAIFIIGLVMGFYWHHRRIWVRIDDGRLLLGAHTNKNWFGLRKEVSEALKITGIEVEASSLDNGRNLT